MLIVAVAFSAQTVSGQESTASINGTILDNTGAVIVINVTSVGLYPNVDARLNLQFDSLQRRMVMADVITNPPLSALLREADARGCRGIDGLGMLVNQRVIGVEHWFGISAGAAVMSAKLKELFGVW